MASFPGAKVRYPGNRRKLGRGQVATGVQPVLTITTPSADVMRITADQAVVFRPAILATVATLTRVSQSQTSPTVVDITFSGAVATHAWTVPAGAGTSYLGVPTPAASGTF